jgi:hypothetical protein
MISDDTKLDEIQKFILHIYDVFEKRPGLLGRPNDLPPILWVARPVTRTNRRAGARPNQPTNSAVGCALAHLLWPEAMLSKQEPRALC